MRNSVCCEQNCVRLFIFLFFSFLVDLLFIAPINCITLDPCSAQRSPLRLSSFIFHLRQLFLFHFPCARRVYQVCSNLVITQRMGSLVSQHLLSHVLNEFEPIAKFGLTKSAGIRRNEHSFQAEFSEESIATNDLYHGRVPTTENSSSFFITLSRRCPNSGIQRKLCPADILDSCSREPFFVNAVHGRGKEECSQRTMDTDRPISDHFDSFYF